MLRPAKLLQRFVYTIQEMSAQVDTEEQFDSEFDVDDIALQIVNNIKSDIKSKYGNRKRHKQ
jgi:hypothetical protein